MREHVWQAVLKQNYLVDKIFKKIFSRADLSLQLSEIAHFPSQISEK